MLRMCLATDDRAFGDALTRDLSLRGLRTERVSMGALLSGRSRGYDLAAVDLPDIQSAASTFVRAREQVRGPLIALLCSPREAAVIAPLASGADGVMLRSSGADALIYGVRAIEQGGIFIDSAVGATVVELASIAAQADEEIALTTAELRVLTRFPKALSNAEIARDLGVSVNTVKTHVRHVLSKLGCDDRVEAVRAARQRGLIS